LEAAVVEADGVVRPADEVQTVGVVKAAVVARVEQVVALVAGLVEED
jgi:hypothetical protein